MTTPKSHSKELRYILTTIAIGDAESDFCVFDDDRLVYACYDNGRTQVLDPTAQRSRGIVEILKDAVPTNANQA